MPVNRRAISWVAGAAHFVFLWWVGGALLGSELTSYVFVPIAVALLARQYLRHRRSLT